MERSKSSAVRLVRLIAVEALTMLPVSLSRHDDEIVEAMEKAATFVLSLPDIGMLLEFDGNGEGGNDEEQK